MKNKWLEDYTIKPSDDVYYAHWKLYKNKALLAVLDENDIFKGVVSISDLNKTYNNDDLKTVEQIYNPNCKYIKSGETALDKSRSIFVDFKNINHIPVVDESGQLVDIISREQAFWKMYFEQEKLPRMHYAYCIYMAALEARTLGYKSISVLEFGVAGGNGLLNCEFHAKAVSQLMGVDIQIYGFDSGKGLPLTNSGYKDMIHLFHGGDYKMDIEKLKTRLEKAQLVLGDIKDTTQTFINEYNPSPIGCMLVDVDYYSSSLPILEFLKQKDSAFLPRIYMYWDDISPEYEFQGENLAIHEFNQANENIKISPEKEYYQNYRQKIKICHKFSHERYNAPSDVYVGIGSFRHESPFFFHELPLQAKKI